MITNFKIYENKGINPGKRPDIGNFVITKDNPGFIGHIKNYSWNDFKTCRDLKNYQEYNLKYPVFLVEFDTINRVFMNPMNVYKIPCENIVYWAEDMEILLPYIQANKFGL
jgi:hypothetical protein